METSVVSVNASEPSASGKRTAQSCVRCKNRKTKCINPEPGPCHYCTRIKKPCVLATKKRRNAPSSEDHEHATRILQQLFPADELNSEFLRNTAMQLERRDAEKVAVPETLARSLSSIPGPVEDDTLHRDDGGGDLASLTSNFGCYLTDSSKQRRYVGLGSDICFHASVRSHVERRHVPADSEIPPPRPAPLPPMIKSMATLTDAGSLPPRDLAEQYVARFCEEVQCCYWFFSSEQLYQKLEDIYASTQQEKQVSRSWICTLLSVFSLGSMRDDPPLDISLTAEQQHCSYSLVFLFAAKATISEICDEADAETTCALCILSLALQVHGYTTLAYLYIGAGVRVAITLGWDQQRSTAGLPPHERERVRKLWCTLYLVDELISSASNRPPAVLGFSYDIPRISEQILNPGLNTPPGYLQALVSLHKMRRQMRNDFYDEQHVRFQSAESLHTIVFHHLREHQTFQSTLPSHLQWGPPAAPPHHRAIGLLHLHYWYSVISITRLFLRHLAIQHRNQSFPATSSTLQRLSMACFEAASSSFDVIASMHRHQALSGMNPFDCSCIVANVMIFILAKDLSFFSENVFLSRVTDSLVFLRSITFGRLSKSKHDEIITLFESLGVSAAQVTDGGLSLSIDSARAMATSNRNNGRFVFDENLLSNDILEDEHLLYDETFWNLDLS
ncbi:hypothetical protein N7474_006724 [Penicillium riverlandense]|uniref:uncharacterized protein n=1 Tax=Penicillium riverlandense TaxID=1903569 RepID=UPI0025482D59|nr:uncharacterized protein N7474_006724 [Penicillium riverlandense]KAJ5814947.1 hypothetical protein N7474_006724 [Penicillium riverlandense]